jgi:hypothetical protein
MNSNTTPIDRAAINRENSQKSTGPKSEAGKKRSSLNALRHGLTGQVVVMPGEDLAAYELHTAAMHKDLKPVGYFEIQLAQSIADDTWRLNRARALETNVHALAFNDNGDSVVTDHPEAHAALVMAKAIGGDHSQKLAMLCLQQQRISRNIRTNFELLRKIQAERRETEREELFYAAKLYESHVAENKTSGATEPYNPAAHGFVISLPQVEAYALRDKVKELALAAA